jgi:ADP-ribose pyrophosphatase YjhB (NUDIX family)
LFVGGDKFYPGPALAGIGLGFYHDYSGVSRGSVGGSRFGKAFGDIEKMALEFPMQIATRHPIACAANFILDDQNRLLTGLRMKKTAIPGVPEWGLPAGKIDWMETAEAAAIREAREEAGIDIAIDRLVCYSNDFFPGQDAHYVTLYFQSRLVTGIPTLLEPEKISEWKWQPLSEITHLFTGCHRFLPLLVLK